LYYGTETKFVKEIRKFIEACGIEVITVHDSNLMGYAENEKIKRCLNNAGCALGIGTPDRQVIEGYKTVYEPNPSVFETAGEAIQYYGKKNMFICEGNMGDIPIELSGNKKIYVCPCRNEEDYMQAVKYVITGLREFKIIR